MITVTVKNVLIAVCSDENTARSFVRYFDKKLTEEDMEEIMEGKKHKEFKLDYMPSVDEKFMRILKGEWTM